MKRTGKCFYCEREFDWLTRDHVLPVSKGGKSTNNIVLACQRCNAYKSNWLISDFVLYLVHFRPKYFMKHGILDTVIENAMSLVEQRVVQVKVKPNTYSSKVVTLKVVGNVELPEPKKRSRTKGKLRKKKVPSVVVYSEKLDFHHKQKLAKRNMKAFAKIHGLGCVSEDNFHED